MSGHMTVLYGAGAFVDADEAAHRCLSVYGSFKTAVLEGSVIDARKSADAFLFAGSGEFAGYMEIFDEGVFSDIAEQTSHIAVSGISVTGDRMIPAVKNTGEDRNRLKIGIG